MRAWARKFFTGKCPICTAALRTAEQCGSACPFAAEVR